MTYLQAYVRLTHEIKSKIENERTLSVVNDIHVIQRDFDNDKTLNNLLQDLMEKFVLFFNDRASRIKRRYVITAYSKACEGLIILYTNNESVRLRTLDIK